MEISNVDILKIHYGEAVPLVDPKQQLDTITAIAVPNPYTRGSKVCFVIYRDITNVQQRRVLKVHAYTGRPLLENTDEYEITEKDGVWCYRYRNTYIPIYVLVDVTQRLHHRMIFNI